MKQATQREASASANPAAKAAPAKALEAKPLEGRTSAAKPMPPPRRGPAAASAYRTQAAAYSPEQREQLILEHLPQVRLIARRIHERLPESVNLDDLVSTGVVGLISAIDRFDAAHNVKLKTYAEYKIRGAILDSLRGLDWAPRQQRKRSKQIESAILAIEQRVHRSPAEDEIAAELGLSLEEYYTWLVEIRGLNLGSLENASGEDENRDLLKFVSDDEESWPSRLLDATSSKNCWPRPSRKCRMWRRRY